MSMLIHIISDNWKLVSDRSECGGSETGVGQFGRIYECAQKCKDISSMFAFGTNDFGNPRCIKGGVCKCLCETSATKQGSCNQVDHKGYRLYRFRPGMLFPRH